MKTAINEAHTLTFRAGDVTVSMPTYVGCSPELAKSILNHLRAKCGAGSSVQPPGSSFIKVENATPNMAQREMEQRLRVDFATLRDLLFGSSRTGVRLDLLMRVQRELEDSFTFLSQDLINQALKHAMEHYSFHCDNYTLPKKA